jgi:hypothetical protein
MGYQGVCSTSSCPTDSCRNGGIPLESAGMAQESAGMDRNPQEWHRNGLKWSPELNEDFILRIDKQYVSTRVIQDILIKIY